VGICESRRFIKSIVVVPEERERQTGAGSRHDETQICIFIEFLKKKLFLKNLIEVRSRVG
jgi:hypothetical protein